MEMLEELEAEFPGEMVFHVHARVLFLPFEFTCEVNAVILCWQLRSVRMRLACHAVGRAFLCFFFVVILASSCRFGSTSYWTIVRGPFRGHHPGIILPPVVTHLIILASS